MIALCPLQQWTRPSDYAVHTIISLQIYVTRHWVSLTAPVHISWNGVKGWQDGRLIFFSSIALIFFFFFFSVMLPFSRINKQSHAFSVFIPCMDWIYQTTAYREKREGERGMGKQLSVSSSWVCISSLRSVELFIFYKQRTYPGLCRRQHEMMITMLLWKKSKRTSCRSKSASEWH